MDPILNDVEARIVGALLEKEKTTPETYPLTLNALTKACNQKSNRNPVVDFDEKTVAQALDSLTFKKNLVKRVLSEDSRVARYRQDLDAALDLNLQELAVLCILMLRGPQTVGEIRGRTERIYGFESLEEVDVTLQGLVDRTETPLVVRLPRRPGMKEARYAHLLAGEVEVDETEILEPAVLEVRADNQRIETLEAELETLREELQELRQQFAEFRKQFE
ncbi:MAG: YceH family protein [bacterium]|nr:YceH family protein [bacterium]